MAIRPRRASILRSASSRAGASVVVATPFVAAWRCQPEQGPLDLRQARAASQIGLLGLCGEAAQARDLVLGDLESATPAGQRLLELVHERGLLAQRLAQAIDLLDVGHGRASVLLERLVALGEPAEQLFVGAARGEAVAPSGCGRGRRSRGRRSRGRRARRCLRRLEPPHDVLPLGLERGDALVAIGQRRLARRQLGLLAAQFLAQPRRRPGLAAAPSGRSPAGDPLGQRGHLLGRLAREREDRLVGLGQRATQAGDLSVELGPRLGPAAQTRA